MGINKNDEAYLGIDIGSISTKGVVIDAGKNIIARSYLWTEGNPAAAAKRVAADLAGQLAAAGSQAAIVGAGTTGSARRLVGAMLGASVIKNEITAHAVGTTFLHPDVRTILEIGGQDSKIICVDGGIAVDYAMNTLCAAGTVWALKLRNLAKLRSRQKSRPTLLRAAPFLPKVTLCTKFRLDMRVKTLLRGCVMRWRQTISIMLAREKRLFHLWFFRAA
jgi:hypothetical protein